MTQTFKYAILITAMFALLIGTSSSPLSAAEFNCVITWGDIPNAMRANPTDLDERFPSGRRPTTSTCADVLIKGEIGSGDSAHFREIIQANHPFLQGVLLWSPGGLVEEAMEIGRIVRRELLKTEAPSEKNYSHPIGAGVLVDSRAIFNPSRALYICNGEDCHCASACFLIWAAGVEREGNALGLHRPSLRSTRFANLPPDRASALYRLLLGEMDSYLTEVEIPHRFIETMTDTSSNDVRWISGDEALSIKESPSLAEWIAAGCDGMSKEDQSVMLEISRRVRQKSASSYEKALYERLSKKDFELYTCKLRRLDNARDAIVQPH